MDLRKAIHFLFHQILSTIGVGITTAFMVFAFSPLIQLLYPTFRVSWFLTEIHFFPAQLMVGFVCGYQIAPRVKTTAGFWTWMIPLALILYAMVISSPPDSLFIPAEKSGVPIESLGKSTSRFWHFFGAGCEPRLRCFDQISLTLPLYAASSYSLGMLLGRKRMRLNKPE